MPASERRITRADILPPTQYAAERKARRGAIAVLKRPRRVAVGPHATFYFENYDTMLQQVLEMLHIEKGGEDQIADELSAYNPLIPQGREFCATLMFEIPDADERARILLQLGGVEEFVFLDIGGERIKAEPEQDIERTTAEGKTSSVHFLHFPLGDVAAAAFKSGARALLAIEHPRYGHIAILNDETKASLAADLA
jgi:hypothetical protein